MSHKRNEALRHVQHSMHHVIAAGEGSDRAPDSCKLCPYYRPDFKFRTCLYAHCPYKKQVNVFRSTPEKWDILYGTGFHGSLRPAGLAACALMNRQRESGAFVLAVDLPSGINTDTGEAAEGAVRADLTVTFDSCKPLHTAPSSAPFCGEIVCADIGIRDEWHPAGLAQL